MRLVLRVKEEMGQYNRSRKGIVTEETYVPDSEETGSRKESDCHSFYRINQCDGDYPDDISV